MKSIRFKKNLFSPALLLLLFSLVAIPEIQAKDQRTAGSQVASGRLVDGFRILSIAPSDHPADFTVYRGDYVKFKIDPSIPSPMLTIPGLKIEKALSGSLADTPIVKMKQTGAYAYQIGDIKGVLNVIAYSQANYREVTAEQGAAVIANESPLILDVRTPKEFKAGHLDQARLVPVQQLASHLDKITAHKNRPIFIYCATGNRSTVASKILIDNGFKQVINLRYGIYDWARRRFKVVK